MNHNKVQDKDYDMDRDKDHNKDREKPMLLFGICFYITYNGFNYEIVFRPR